jgi:hypothetical protein
LFDGPERDRGETTDRAASQPEMRQRLKDAFGMKYAAQGVVFAPH